MCDPVSIGIGLAASTAVSLYQGNQARKDQAHAADVAKTQADQAMNKANPKRPDAAQILYDNQAANSAGVGSTSLTGPSGIDPNTLSLGKTTLLGA